MNIVSGTQPPGDSANSDSLDFPMYFRFDGKLNINFEKIIFFDYYGKINVFFLYKSMNFDDPWVKSLGIRMPRLFPPWIWITEIHPSGYTPPSLVCRMYRAKRRLFAFFSPVRGFTEDFDQTFDRPSPIWPRPPRGLLCDLWCGKNGNGRYRNETRQIEFNKIDRFIETVVKKKKNAQFYSRNFSWCRFVGDTLVAVVTKTKNMNSKTISSNKSDFVQTVISENWHFSRSLCTAGGHKRLLWNLPLPSSLWRYGHLPRGENKNRVLHYIVILLLLLKWS